MHRREFLRTAASCLGAVGFANAAAKIAGGDAGSLAAPADDSKICLNQLGFFPDAPKVATVRGRANSFFVRSMKDQSVVFRSTLSSPSLDRASGDTVQIADFSALRASGEYRLELESGAISDLFPIRHDAYDHALLPAMRSFYGQRCGYAVDLGGGYAHPKCHIEAAYHASSGKTGPCEIHGGWHDAGDYGRYAVNSGITVATLLWAWELYGTSLRDLALQIPESGGKVPDFSAEIQWNLQWMLALQDSDGGVWQKQTRDDFCGFIMPCVWSPPAWMKTGGSMWGGSMREHWFPSHAQYFVKFLQAYAAEGVKVQAITVNNEVDTDQDGHFPATLWGQQYEIGFVVNHLGPALEQASLDTKIWIVDHNYDLWGRAVDELSNARLYKYVDGVAWRSYAGTPDAMSRVHDMFPEKHMYFTEGGPPAHLFDPTQQQQAAHVPFGTDWARWSSAFTNMLRNWARMICVWNLLLDENGRPDLTNPPRPMRKGGLVSLDTKSQQLTYSGNYYAFPHYSKLIQRGARIFASSGDLPGIDHVAAKNPDGSSVLVVTNSGVEQQVQCTLGTRALALVLPADSITSFVW